MLFAAITKWIKLLRHEPPEEEIERASRRIISNLTGVISKEIEFKLGKLHEKESEERVRRIKS